MYKYTFITAITFLLLYGCSKDKQKPANTQPVVTDHIKITVIAGDNQTAAIGYAAQDSITVKVTNNGEPAGNYDVQFIGSGCNDDLIRNLRTKADGTVKYYWAMAADLGTETLKVVAFNSSKRIDSVTVTGTATNVAGDQVKRSACTPNFGGPATSIVQLTTGRLFACFPGSPVIRYSDDNAISWHPLKSLKISSFVVRLAITPADEIFASTQGDGVFFSKDAGVTWADISPAGFNKQDQISSIKYTSSGKLIFTGPYNDIYISADKGKTWSQSSIGLNTKAVYKDPCELKNGDLYIVSFSDTYYKSIDNGTTWTAQNDLSQEHITEICTDNNGWFYKAKITPDGGIYVSKDNGVSFSKIIAVNSFFMVDLSVQSDGKVYFYDYETNNLFRIADNNNNLIALNKTYPVYVSSYLKIKNGTFLYADGGIAYY